MLTMLGSPRRACDGLTRRETLQAGSLALLGGFGLPQLLQAEERPRPRPLSQRAGKDAPAKRKASAVLLYLLGGAATQDMIDLKPNAATEVRGEFNPIATNVPGIQIGEHLPKMSRWMHKITAGAVAQSSRPSLPQYAAERELRRREQLLDNTSTRNTYPPSMGSVCEHLRVHSADRRESESDLPDYVYMPCYLGWGQAIRRPGPYAGFLGQRYDALYTEVMPHRAADGPTPAPGRPVTVLGEPRLPESTLAPGITIDRLNERRGLMHQIEDQLPRRAGRRSHSIEQLPSHLATARLQAC